MSRPVGGLAPVTGSVLSSTRVLTAAHCSIAFPYGYTEVIAGRSNLETQGSGFVARVGATWTHQGYNLEAQFDDPTLPPVDDVTVLTLEDTLPAVYTPVTLAAQGAADPAEGTDAKIAFASSPGDETPTDLGPAKSRSRRTRLWLGCPVPATSPEKMMCSARADVDTGR